MVEACPKESFLRDFEAAWQAGDCGSIEEYLQEHPRPQSDSAQWQSLLVEMICLEMEFRNREPADVSDATCAKNKQSRSDLEVYLCRFPELGSLATLPIELIVEEYRVRQLWGDRPDHQLYVQRFGNRDGQLKRGLSRVDAEIAAEREEAVIASHEIIPRKPIAEWIAAAIDLEYRDFVLQQLIGAGRTGKVYRAVHKPTGQIVAVKYLRKSLIGRIEIVERFVNESRIVRRLHHPAIVAVQGLGRTPGGGFFIALEYLPGGDLCQAVHKQPPDVASIVGWLSTAAAAIQHAHDHDLIHCDLKPSNLLLDSDNHIRATDFGLARSTVDEWQAAFEIEGTAAFMAPEQVSRYWGPVDARTDVYGLGAVLFHLLTGKPPHLADTMVDTLAAVVSAKEVVFPRHVAGGSSCELIDSLLEICRHCLAKCPAERFQTAQAVCAALTSIGRAFDRS